MSKANAASDNVQRDKKEWLFSLGYSFGGDSLSERGDNVRAGELVTVSMARLWQLQDNWYLQTGLGFQFDFGSAESEADVEYYYFTRWPTDLLVSYLHEKHRFAGGVTYVLSPRFKGGKTDINNTGEDITLYGDEDFENSLGFSLEYSYNFNKKGWVGLRYTGIDYESQDRENREIDGSALSITVQILF
jgi:hypothetical protein